MSSNITEYRMTVMSKLAPAVAIPVNRIVRTALTVILSALFVLVLRDLIKHIQVYQGISDGNVAPYELELVYHRSVWLVLIFAAILLAAFQKYPTILAALVTLFAIEYISLKMYPRVIGHEFRPAPPILQGRFAPHPLLEAVLSPGTYGRASHTAEGQRFTVNLNKGPNAKRVFVYGASTTYDNGVADNLTWSSALSDLLGRDYVVENHGVPGYSTVQHIIQVLFDFRTTPPACAVFYVGGTDLQESNLTDLKPDYSDFLLVKLRNMATVHLGMIQRRWVLLSLLSELDHRTFVPPGRVSRVYDQRLSQIYRQNIKLIAIITQSFGVKPIFVPEIWNDRRLTADSPTILLPYINDSDVKKNSSQMNADLEAVANETNSVYLAEPLRANWENADFLDYAHFSAKGSSKLASSIAPRIAAECK
jgi:lysophospholipase L1-like esterase